MISGYHLGVNEEGITMQKFSRQAAMRAFLTVAATGLLAAGAPAAAQQSAESMRYGAANPPPFEVVDADGNGVITPDEVHLVGVPFTMLDRDGSGTVSRVEYMNSTARYAIPENDVLGLNVQANKQ